MTTLHKQNFDLKLELYHRRERQTQLEQAVEGLQAEKDRAEQTGDQLVREMEKRDKALEEAVQMIIGLENRIELLLREREMMRQLDAGTALLSQLADSPSTTLVDQDTTKKPQPDVASPEKHNLPRMPSFLSDRTETTENLRNFYLNNHGSLLSLAKTDTRAGNNGFVSPSMSILSESSFVSIYGQKAFQDSSSPPDILRKPLSRLGDGGQRSVSLPMAKFMPNKSQWSEHLKSSDDAKGVLDASGRASGPQDSKRSTAHLPAGHDAATGAKSCADIDRSSTARPTNTHPLLRLGNSKERPPSNRKIISDDLILNQQHCLPPTPDTVTSSMLNHGQNSHTTSRRGPDGDDLNRLLSSRPSVEHADDTTRWRFRSADIAQPPSVTAFTGGQERSSTTYYESQLSPFRRPHSAGETTISRHNNDWDSCSEDDICSEASSFDYWMREGLRPSLGGATKIQKDHMSAARNPPDLFGFPSEKEWPSYDILDAPSGLGRLGANASFSPAVDAMPQSLPSPEEGIFGAGLAGSSLPRPSGTAIAPPAPYRRSSLRARTSAPGTPTASRAPGSQTKNHDGDSSRKRSVSGHVLSTPNQKQWLQTGTNGQTANTPSVRTHIQQQDKPAEKRHYPPQASQSQTAARPRSKGITSLFRRSLGSAHTPLQPSASVPATSSPFPVPEKKDTFAPLTTGVPGWERRNDLFNEGASATPPPIMRNRPPKTSFEAQDTIESYGSGECANLRPARSGLASGASPGLGAGLSSVLNGQEGGAPLAAAGRDDSGRDDTTTQNNQVHGRKWFGLGRVTSLRTGGTEKV